MEFLGFMFFSAVETLALFSLIMSLFRLKMTDHIGRALIVITLINLQSFLLRNELDVPFLVPVITLLMIVLFFNIIVKIPMLWSLFCTVLSYVIFAVIQSLLLVVIFGSIETATETAFNGYLLQMVSGAVLILISWIMYKQHFGFKPEKYDRLKIKFEHTVVMTLMILFLILISIIFYMNQIWFNIVFFVMNLGYFFFFAIQERAAAPLQDQNKTDTFSG
ncbi:hypothetical protein [Paenibacillus sp. Marseille-Q4541]|uniref:hypothetical protein n=1 Tax=Paenibacillus sp. Marseille-Q4541 TaxID=2831522 RepID=UPI001BAC4B2B|nr:hypothetical protein [Paenibacillus sp. Marseille-Q4541]